MAITKRPLATAEQIQTEASGYILCKLGNFLWAGEPTFDAKRKLWTVPIHSRALPEDGTLGHILLDANAKIVQAPSRQKLMDLRKQMEMQQNKQPTP